MITYADLEDLLDFHSERHPIVSFYLNTDRSRHTLDEQRITARNMIRDEHKAVDAGSWNETVRSALHQDLDRLEQYLENELTPGLTHRGLAIFACRAAGLWRAFGLPRPVPSILILETTPHIRPLTLILDEYHRFGVLVLDRRSAELYETYIGEMLKVDAFPLPSGTPAAAAVEHPGSGDRGISTHRDESEMQRHFRRMADTLFHLSHRRHYEYLVLGGQKPILTQFENFLHPTLREKLAGRFPAEPGKVRPARILEEVSVIEREVEIRNERRVVEELINAAHARGLALLGMEKVLEALRLGAVYMLLVEDGWRIPGVLCRHCGYMGLKGEECPGCGRATDAVGDIVDDAIESALRTGSIIEHVNPAAGLADQGHIGAMLRFKFPAAL